ncbi:MAG: type II toxin-antitoxin system VapC family toxin [Syntrophales bacterium]|nr:type II toxin-antitoxin system VapC family toxin [Syntrophales bacterium]
MIWVIDSSVVVRWFLKTERHPHADAVMEQVVRQTDQFMAPELFAFEVYTVLCRLHPKGSEVFVEGVMPLLEGGILRQPMTGNLARQASFYVEKGLAGYDACYAALAKEIGGLWLTFDGKAHRCIENCGVSLNLMVDLPENW